METIIPALLAFISVPEFSIKGFVIMLSGAIGLQIIARRLSVELGEQQFNKFNDIDKRELTFKTKKLSSDHSLICRAPKKTKSGLSTAVKKQPVLALKKWALRDYCSGSLKVLTEQNGYNY